MNPSRRRFHGWLAGACALVWLSRPAAAPPVPESPAADRDAAAPALSSPLPASSPVQIFRELLALTPAEQREFLADRPPEQQRRILAKLREYESLRPTQRELRLRVTELGWYLWPLLTTPAAQRAATLAAIPEDLRRLVEDRLREWDRLPPASRQELLENEATLRYFTQVGPVTAAQKEDLLRSLSPARREKLEAGIAQWQSLPDAQRQKMLDRFNRFFDLTPAEKERALGRLSDAERRQMERTLKRFDQLPADQRAGCVQAFAKFTSMSLEERQQFLKNAERWRLMSPEERQAWRELVQQLAEADQPPLPPGFPAPPGAAVATNARK